MYLLDTNVISEMRKFRTGHGEASVFRWVKSVDSDALYLSAITVFEMESGVLRLMPKDVAQARLLGDWLHLRVLPKFTDHILPVDQAVALQCAALHVPKTKAYRDSLIAATALVHGMTVVTRNEKDFVPMGVPVLNPWVG
jgi:predicted nucleic acid-binding protein